MKHRTQRLASKQAKALLYGIQGGQCAQCGAPLDQFEAHHIRPWAQQGETETWNLQLLCPYCHKEKRHVHTA